MRWIFAGPIDGDRRRRFSDVMSVGSPSARAWVPRGWLRRRIEAIALPSPQDASGDGGELPAPRRQPSDHLVGFSSDSPSVGRARLAVLIDADNAQASLVERVLAEVATFGTANVKRAYGDWTGTGLRSWKEQLLAQSIQPVQQFAYVAGKNATDAAMVIDAMDLLYRGRLDGFCLVSSDSDFTRLAARLRESGRIVYGFGQRKTPRSFVAACDKFVYVENLADPPAGLSPTGAPCALPVGARTASPVAASSVAVSSVVVSSVAVDGMKPASGQPMSGARLRGDTRLVNGLRDAVEEASDDDGWANQAYVGHIISRRSSDFDPRDYGYRKLGSLIAAIDLFEVERRSSGTGKPDVVYLRDKRHPRIHLPVATPNSES